jgi:hypothetical protein
MSLPRSFARVWFGQPPVVHRRLYSPPDASLQIESLTLLEGKTLSDDFLPDTPNLGIPWCRVCEPDRDPFVEILETQYCSLHVPSYEFDDGCRWTVAGRPHLSSSSDAGGDDNRALCDQIHRPDVKGV